MTVLLMAKAILAPAFAFLSMEPLLGGVDLTRAATRRVNLSSPAGERWERYDVLRGRRYESDHKDEWVAAGADSVVPAIDWVITGGETDQGEHKARPSSPAWFRSLRDQCADAGVAYHHKQNGEHAPASALPQHFKRTDHHTFPDGTMVHRVGKRVAGRLLDGVVHDARPA